ncbi:G-protein coupled receptor 35 [Brachyhypopomus gauderio]|uniref:G-protein coupled receptor 35 n=1 Tax=Brachyhypopomus gauderio TaxID=698409 RepID=UPI004041F883
MEFNCSVPSNNSGPRVVEAVAYTPVFVAGLLLNTSAIWFFFQLRSWTDTHVYMFNLIFADLLLVMFLPFRIYDSIYNMDLTKFCLFLHGVHYVNMYVSMFTIAVISAHRFVVVRFPLLAKALDSKRKMIARVACALVWVVVITLSVRLLYSLTTQDMRTCFDRKLGKTKLPKLLVLEIVGYLLPMATVVTCSTGAMCTVQKAAEDSLQHAEEKNAAGRRKVVAIIRANMVVFLVCFTPLHVAYLLRYIYKCPEHVSYLFLKVSQWIAATNCCLDSVGYYFLLKKVLRDKNLPSSDQSSSVLHNIAASQRVNTLTVPM